MDKEQGMGFFAKMRGVGRSPLKVSGRNAVLGLIGGFVTIFVLASLADLTSTPWVMAPFGASCVLAFGLWDAPLSQPRNIIGGHLISTFIGLLLFHMFGSSIWVMAAGVGLAIGLMMLTKTTHPPAGADPLVVIMAGSGWSFLLTPVLAGSVCIVIIALIINNLHKHRRYPTFWF
ncbi:HPP family protein [Paenibacillus pinihumi]|uniref:HPP family protein n=1 Tax=Paenibacillus pinihumi TaxID=669462 RepID=UPI0004298059|nr:HPP family protein [Paenibacillus pinihumi]